MNARVFLLVFVSAIFMSVWDADQRAMEAAFAKKQQKSSNPAQIAVTLSRPRGSEPMSFPVEMTNECAVVPPAVADPVVHLESEAALVTPLAVAFHSESIPVLASIDDHIAHQSTESVQPVTVNANEIVENCLPTTSDDVSIIDLDGSANSSVIDHDHVVTEQQDAQPSVRKSAAATPADRLSDAFGDLLHIGEAPEDWTLAEHSEVAGSREVANLTADLADTISDADSGVSDNTQESAVVHPFEWHIERQLPATHDQIEHDADEQQAETATVSSGSSVTSATTSSILPIVVNGPFVPIPVNLADGTWQVMNHAGDTFKITIDRPSARTGSADGSATTSTETRLEENVCLTTSPDGQLWCFIRSYAEQTVPAPQAATEFFSPARR